MALNEIALFFKKRTFLLLVLAIIALGIFLRTYHFSDWMHFELDQARDANLVSNAIDRGAGDLPLLGPKARGTLLRLGPVFYYFEYVSAKIFGNTPPAMAYPVWFFSALSLPVFYLLMRRFFNRKISSGLLAVFSLSLFLIMYSRFAWNPNSLPFFLLLALYALLRAVDRQEKRKGWWLMAAFAAVSIASQLHFLTFVLLPIFFIAFLFVERPPIALKFWAAAFSVALFFYVPVIINELKTGGKNTEQLLETIANRAEGENISLGKKIAIASIENARYYFLIVSGKDDSEIFNINPAKGANVLCGEGCLSAHPLGIFSFVFFLLGLILLVWRFKKETAQERKSFLRLNLLWFFLTMILLVPLAANLSPRFFLLALPLPFVFLGIILDNLISITKNLKTKIAVLILVFGGLAAANAHETFWRFSELARADQEAFPIKEDRILKEKMRVTFGQEKKIVKYMLNFNRQNGQPVFYMSTAEHRPAFEYLLKRSGVLYDEISKNKVYREGNFFLILPTVEQDNWDLRLYQNNYRGTETINFGTLTMLRLEPNEAAITAERKDFTPTSKKETRSKAPRYKWNQIFSNSSGEDEEE